MQERRIEPRLLCADLVPVEWADKNGRPRRATANLEDISISGACLQLDYAVPVNTVIRITYSKGILEGTIRYCVCLLYTSPSPRDRTRSRMPSSA